MIEFEWLRMVMYPNSETISGSLGEMKWNYQSTQLKEDNENSHLNMNMAGGTDANSLRVESDTTATAALGRPAPPSEPPPEGDAAVAQPKLLLTANFHLSSLKMV